MTSYLTNLLMLLSFFLLASCQNDVKDVNTTEGSSTFVLGEIKAVSFSTYASDSNWPDLKDKASVDLTVCIMDRKYLDKVVGEDFSIVTDLNSSEDPSNGQGCITWNEEFEFDSTADETFYKVDGTIEGQSNYKGAKNFKIAVNPWNKTVIDLEFGSAQKLMSINPSAYTKSLKNQLEIEKYDVDINEVSFEKDGSRANLNLTVSTKPILFRKALDNTKRRDNLSGGTFETEFILFQRSKGTGDRVEIASQIKTSSIDEDGNLKTDLEFEVRESLDTEAVLELAIKTIPKSPSLDIGNNEGLIIIKSILEPTSGRMSDLPISLNQMKAFSDEIKNKKMYKSSKKSVNTKHGFLIDEINARTVTEGGANLIPGNNDRQLHTEFTLNLVDSLVREGISSSFDIEVIDKVTNSVIESYTGKSTKLKKNSGKLIFTPRIDYGEEYEFGYREYTIQLTGTKAPYLGLKQTRTVFLNPRVRDGGFLLDGAEYDHAPDVESEKQPKIRINKFRYDFARNTSDSYKVNKDLDLISKRVVTLKFYPELQLNNNSQGTDGNPLKLPNGEYKVSFIVMTPNNPFNVEYDRTIDLKDFKAITGGVTSEPVSPEDDGMMRVDIELPILFANRQFLALNTVGVVYIESMNENSVFQPGYIMGKLRILESDGVVNPLFDSRLKTEEEVKLIQSNKVVSSLLTKEIKNFEYQLAPDHTLDSHIQEFKDEIVKNVVLPDGQPIMVPVIDHEKHAHSKRAVEMHISESEESMIRDYEMDLTPEQLQRVIINYSEVMNGNADSKIAQELCNLLYDPKQRTDVTIIPSAEPGTIMVGPTIHSSFGEENKRCRKNPAAHMSFKELRFMDKIISQPSDLNIKVRESHSDGVESEAYFSSKGAQQIETNGERDTRFVRKSFHGSFDIVPTLFGPLKAYAALGVDTGSQSETFSMKVDQELLSNQRRIINQRGQKFLIDSIQLAFEARVRKCIVIGANYVSDIIPQKYIRASDTFGHFWDWFTDKDNSVTVTSPDRHFVCLNASRVEIVPEEWWFVRLKVSKDATGDGGLMRNSMAGSVIRGKNAYKEFREINLERDKALIFKMESDETVVERYKNYLEKKGKGLRYKQRIGTGFPGLHE